LPVPDSVLVSVGVSVLLELMMVVSSELLRLSLAVSVIVSAPTS
jgi:hypothetical protein